MNIIFPFNNIILLVDKNKLNEDEEIKQENTIIEILINIYKIYSKFSNLILIYFI